MLDPRLRLKDGLPLDAPEYCGGRIPIREGTADVARGEDVALPNGQRAAEEFEAWLGGLLKRLPKAPVLPPEAMDRAQIYDE